VAFGRESEASSHALFEFNALRLTNQKRTRFHEAMHIIPDRHVCFGPQPVDVSSYRNVRRYTLFVWFSNCKARWEKTLICLLNLRRSGATYRESDWVGDRLASINQGRWTKMKAMASMSVFFIRHNRCSKHKVLMRDQVFEYHHTENRLSLPIAGLILQPPLKCENTQIEIHNLTGTLSNN